MIGEFKGKYRFLSNFYPARVVLDGVTYPSTEHAYQAAKCTDPDYRASILRATMAESKQLGKTAKLRSDWEQVKFSIMEDLVRQKFTNDSGLKQLLLDTGDEELVEGNWWGDKIWGVCKGVGENHLGKILMKIRAELNAN